jgi:hypothetical protein
LKGVGHPHFRVFDNSTDFEGKVQRVVDTICTLIGVPKPFACTRKFVVKDFSLKQLQNIRFEEFITERTYIQLNGQNQDNENFMFVL